MSGASAAARSMTWSTPWARGALANPGSAGPGPGFGSIQANWHRTGGLACIAVAIAVGDNSVPRRGPRCASPVISGVYDRRADPVNRVLGASLPRWRVRLVRNLPPLRAAVSPPRPSQVCRSVMAALCEVGSGVEWRAGHPIDVRAVHRARLHATNPLDRRDTWVKRHTDGVGIVPDGAATTRTATSVHAAQMRIAVCCQRVQQRPMRAVDRPALCRRVGGTGRWRAAGGWLCRGPAIPGLR